MGKKRPNKKGNHNASKSKVNLEVQMLEDFLAKVTTTAPNPIEKSVLDDVEDDDEDCNDNVSLSSSSSEGSGEEWEDVDDDFLNHLRDPLNLNIGVYPEDDGSRLWSENGFDFVSTVIQQAKNITAAANATTAASVSQLKKDVGLPSKRKPIPTTSAQCSQNHKPMPKLVQQIPKISSVDFENFERYRGRQKQYPLNSSVPTEDSPSKGVETPGNQEPLRRRWNRYNKPQFACKAKIRKNLEVDFDWIQERLPVMRSFTEYVKGLDKDLRKKPNEFYSILKLPAKEGKPKKSKVKNNSAVKKKENGSKSKTTTFTEDKIKVTTDAHSSAPEVLKRKIPERSSQKQTEIDARKPKLTPTNSEMWDQDQSEVARISGYQFHQNYKNKYNTSSSINGFLFDSDSEACSFIEAPIQKTLQERVESSENEPTSGSDFVSEVIKQDRFTLSNDEYETIQLLSNCGMREPPLLNDTQSCENFGGHSVQPCGRDIKSVGSVTDTTTADKNFPSSQSRSNNNLSFEVMTHTDLGLHLEAMDEDAPYVGLEFINGDVSVNDNDDIDMDMDQRTTQIQGHFDRTSMADRMLTEADELAKLMAVGTAGCEDPSRKLGEDEKYEKLFKNIDDIVMKSAKPSVSANRVKLERKDGH